MKTVLATDTLQGDETISWAANHASLQPPNAIPESSVTLTSLLPLFYDQAKSVAMIRHSMDVVKQAVEILNPGQVPIITVDQPLYTVAKQIQWSWPATHGEDHFIVTFGGLHIEMAALKTLGDLLDGSGWTGALVQAGIATPGTADSFLKASHVTRTRRAHQVTASSLYLLLQKAYTEYNNDLEEGDNVMSLEDWCTERAVSCPQFHFWFIILQLELEVMIYVRSIREANFLLYIDALTKIVPWFFALGHTHYARWIPVHLHDMVSLKECHPDVYAQFLKGNFAMKKSKCAFSARAIDQAQFGYSVHRWSTCDAWQHIWFYCSGEERSSSRHRDSLYSTSACTGIKDSANNPERSLVNCRESHQLHQSQGSESSCFQEVLSRNGSRI